MLPTSTWRLLLKTFRNILSAALCLAAIGANSQEVGFQSLSIANGDDAPLVMGIWYPTDAAPISQPLGTFTQSVAPNGAVKTGDRLPLVVMSHGTGGWFGEHFDTALALAHAGFIVAALSHTGDTYDDTSRQLRISDRPGQVRRLVDYMTGQWASHDRLDAGRIGAFGFSAGGFTILAAIGGVPDFRKIPAHCQAHPDYFDCKLLRSGKGGQITANPSVWIHDSRIKAAVIAAPALGFTFGAEGLTTIRIPVQLWRAADDHILPNPDYAEAVRLALPSPPETHIVAKADHFDFLAPCSETLARVAPQICLSEPGFDRAAFHAEFNREVVRFFAATLRAPGR